MKVKIVNKSAYETPFYATEKSAGMDLKANISEPVTLGPLERALVPTGLYIALPDGTMDGGDWWAAIHGVAKGRTRLSDFTFTFHFHTLEKEMATHSSVLAWRIPGTGEPGGLPSMGSHRVGHD